MKTYTQIAVIGGDSRQIHLANFLTSCGYTVQMAGFSDAELPQHIKNISLAEVLNSHKLLVLPLPVSRDGTTLNAAFAAEPIRLQELLRKIRTGCTVFCGMPPENFALALQAHGCRVTDYFKDETLTLRNALLTAEGVVGILTEALPVTVFGLPCAVLGYGRVAQCTARLLKNIGAQVTVFARSRQAQTLASVNGLAAFDLQELKNKIGSFSCVINTIPSPVTDIETIASSADSCVFIELASEPYGIDLTAAKKCGRTLIKASSLPGKTAPKTAGEIIGQSILSHITEES